MSSEVTFPVVERFVSINGEGLRAGRLSAFIRMAGCNLACSWCDTSWANEKDCPYEELSVSDLVSWVEDTCVSCVTLTGGEPALQQGLDTLIEALALSNNWGQLEVFDRNGVSQSGKSRYVKLDEKQATRVIEIETNGSLDLSFLHELRLSLEKRVSTPTVLAFTVDCKLPSSGMFAEMLDSNYALLTLQDVVKFVIAGTQDLETALAQIQKYELPSKCEVFFSPVFSCIDPADIVSFMQAHELSTVRLQLQLHKIIWPEKDKGV